MHKVGCAALLALAVCLPSPLFAQDAAIRIGNFNATTGPASSIGDPETKAVRLWARKINEAGGVNGQKIELVEYDDQSKAALAVTYVKRLIEQDKVDIIIGGGVSGNSLAVLPIIEEAKIPFISMGSTSKLTKPLRPWVFKVAAGEDLVVTRIFRHMQKRGLSKIGLLSSTSAYGAAGRDVALELASTLGVQIVSDERYSDGDKDMSPQLNNMRNTGMQAVFIFGSGAAAALAAKSVHTVQMNVPLYLTSGNSTARFIQLAGDAAEGILMPSNGLPVAEQLSPTDPQKKIFSDLKREFEGEYKIEVSGFSGTGYDALAVVVDAVKRAKTSKDRNKVREALEQTRDLVLASGTINYGATDHTGLDVSALRMMRIEKGQFVLLAE